MIDTQRIIDVISRMLAVDKEQVVGSASLSDDLGADSLDMVELSLALEEEFNVEMSDAELESIRTVQDIFDLAEGLPS